ncbi:hypothetical protein ACQ4N7_20320 [Nodosilinea sp. AN01ver1]
MITAASYYNMTYVYLVAQEGEGLGVRGNNSVEYSIFINVVHD